MSVYYILAEILPKEILCSYQFNPDKIEILVDGLKDEVSNSEKLERAYDLIDHSNDLREIDPAKNEYSYTYPDEKLLNELDYYYKNARGRSIKEDFLISLRIINNEIFSIFHFEMYDTSYYEEIINNITLFLIEKKGMDHLSAASLIDKTILSNHQGNAIIMGYLSNGEYVSIINDNELQSEYSSYLKQSDLLEHSTRK